MRSSFLLLSVLILISFSCQQEPSSNEKTPPLEKTIVYPEDVHSFSEPNKAVTKHLSLNLVADFSAKKLSGYARYEIANNNATELILDIRDLNIEKVTVGEDEKAAKFQLGEARHYLGQPLKIAISPETTVVTIYYSTSENAAALDWVPTSQTADKTHSFLFTQGQAILTRTWIPCQDSPGIRITYDATIQVEPGMLAVMSAENPFEKNASGKYTFKMEQPIPPYLLALAAGNIEFGKVGDRTGVYAEPSVLESAVYEFGDMERMLTEAEKLYGDYLWDRYDVIVLPPSFPFGGMENPRLTFVTPTVIAGDRSLTSLIAHELAHSWSGNLVTNSTWDDFWLNEGFTVYFERRIMEVLYGEEYTKMLALLGFQDLQATVEDLGPQSADTHLKLALKGRDPDEGMTDIAYEKGAYFLTLLEQQVGREKFDAFLSEYFETHRFQTISTDVFLEYLQEKLIDPNNVQIDVKEWIFGPGIPENCPKVESDKFVAVERELGQALKGASLPMLQTDDWTTHEWLHFIRSLPQDTDKKLMAGMDQTFTFSDSGNSEIKAAWYELSIRNGYVDEILPKVEAFLVEVGRRKFLTPLYRAFKESGKTDTAKAIYAKARQNYHTVSTQTIDALLGK